MKALIVDAIQNRRRLAIIYDPGIRIIEPHAIGHTKDNNIVVRAYQTSGASNSSEHEHWKLFRLDRFDKADYEGSNFDGPRDGYRKGDRAMQGGIIAEL